MRTARLPIVRVSMAASRCLYWGWVYLSHDAYPPPPPGLGEEVGVPISWYIPTPGIPTLPLPLAYPPLPPPWCYLPPGMPTFPQVWGKGGHTYPMMHTPWHTHPPPLRYLLPPSGIPTPSLPLWYLPPAILPIPGDTHPPLRTPFHKGPGTRDTQPPPWEGTWDQVYLPPPVNRHTPVKTLPSHNYYSGRSIEDCVLSFWLQIKWAKNYGSDIRLSFINSINICPGKELAKLTWGSVFIFATRIWNKIK